MGELLDTYPELEKVLMEMSPAFHKLKNPILRKTVARVATLQQISVVGGLPVDQIVNRLRKEAGQHDLAESSGPPESLPGEIPVWVDENKIVETYDASAVINAGESPMSQILKKANSLRPGEILELQTPFVPAPIIDMLKSKGFRVSTISNGSKIISYISPAE